MTDGLNDRQTFLYRDARTHLKTAFAVVEPNPSRAADYARQIHHEMVSWSGRASSQCRFCRFCRFFCCLKLIEIIVVVVVFIVVAFVKVVVVVVLSFSVANGSPVP